VGCGLPFPAGDCPCLPLFLKLGLDFGEQLGDVFERLGALVKGAEVAKERGDVVSVLPAGRNS
jgi:hypothetical protein